MEFVEKYWPSLIGAGALAVAGYVLWPSGETVAEPEDSGILLGPDVSQDPDSRPPLEGELIREVPQVTEERGKPAPEQEPTYEMREVVQVVQVVQVPQQFEMRTMTQNDPEVEDALEHVKIELLQTNTCPHCREAREFLTQNGLNYSIHNMAESRVEKRARQLTGATQVPILVIDGRPTVGFSKESFEAALAVALKNRMGG